MKKIYLAHAYSDEKLIRLWQINTQKKMIAKYKYIPA